MLAKIAEVRQDGLVVQIRDGAGLIDAWLPSSEWSANSADWNTSSAALKPGMELDVVLLALRFQGRAMVSRKQVAARRVHESQVDEVREMQVVDIARTIIRGTMGDGLPAFIGQEPYLRWIEAKRLAPEWFDHSVLGRGDTVRGFLKATSSEFNAAELDPVAYLDYREGWVAQQIQFPGPLPPEQIVSERHAIPDKRGRIGNLGAILLADDNDDLRDAVAATLRTVPVNVGRIITNDEEGEAFLAGLAEEGLYDLAILDPNLDTDSSSFTGLKIAQALLSHSSCRIVLMTGEVNKLKNWGDLKVHGFLEKPFTMDQMLGEIEEACTLVQPLPLKDWVWTLNKPRVQNVPPSEVSSELSLANVIQVLGKLKPGAVIHVFDLHPRSFRATSLAHSGEGLRWLALSGKIAKSVIKDTAFSSQPLLESEARDKPQHLWTLQMMDYRSFCGVPVRVRGQALALVAFHHDAHAFDQNFVFEARLASEQIARVVERQRLLESRGNEATQVSFGMALASIAHELVSEVTALNGNLRSLTDQILGQSADSQKELKDSLARIRKTVTDISEKTLILRGRSARPENASITYCLRKAAATCRMWIAETLDQPERIWLEPLKMPAENLEVAAPSASLIIVFFNLYLNAAQQIDLASHIRKCGMISQSLSRFVDGSGKSWARVAIHDTGPGIHRDVWERIFDPGYSTKPRGSGLGLYICRHLLQQIGGSVQVTSSAIWNGTIFTVELPLISSQRRDQRREKKERHAQ